MEINQNKVVAITYTLIVDGKEADKATEERPLDFIFGTGMLLPKFEENLQGKKVNDTFEFTLTEDEGYGRVNEDAIVELPKKLFEIDGKIEDGLLTPGNVLPMMDSEGNRLNGAIDEVKADTVVMNFNHPLAGAELHFTGKVEDIREATETELTNGLFNEKVQHSCGDSCGSDCSSCGCGGCH